MNLTQLRSVSRAIIPGLKAEVVNDTMLDLMLNLGVVDIAAYARCLPASKKFNAVADQDEYALSSVIGDYLCPDKPGLYFNRGSVSATDYKKLNPETLASLDGKSPNWRDRDSDDPMAYSIDGDTLTVTPAPDASLASGFWLYYIKRPVSMTIPGAYPFSGTTVEYTHLSIFDLAIVKYAAWQLAPMIGQKTDANLSRDEYWKIRDEKTALFKRRPDISNVGQFQGSIA